MKISACMIAKNESGNIERCIKSYKSIVDDIIVVDTGSTDDTVQIARRHNAEVIAHTWKDDFATPKNLAMDHAKGDWIIFLDADEYFENGADLLLKSTLELVNENKTVDTVMCKMWHYNTDGTRLIGTNPTLRVFRNDKGIRYHGRIHEEPRKDGKPLAGVNAYHISIKHTGYSPEKLTAKHERNCKLLEDEVSAGNFGAKTLQYLVNSYVGLGRYEEALKYINLVFSNEAYLKDLEQAEMLYKMHLARIHVMITLNNKFADYSVRRAIGEALDNFSFHPEIRRIEAIHYFYIWRMDEALEAFTNAIGLNNNYDSQMENNFPNFVDETYCFIGRIHLLKGDKLAALDSFIEALKANKYCKMAFNCLMDIIQQEKPEECILLLNSMYDRNSLEDIQFLISNLALSKIKVPFLYYLRIWNDKFDQQDITVVIAYLMQGNSRKALDLAWEYIQKTQDEQFEIFLIIAVIVGDFKEWYVENKKHVADKYCRLLEVFFNGGLIGDAFRYEQETLFLNLLSELILFKDEEPVYKFLSAFSEILKRLPLQIGDLFFKNGYLDHSLDYYTQALDSNIYINNRSLIYSKIAYNHFKNNNYEDSIQYYEMALSNGYKQYDAIQISKWIGEKDTKLAERAGALIKKYEKISDQAHQGICIDSLLTELDGEAASETKVSLDENRLVDFFAQAEKLLDCNNDIGAEKIYKELRKHNYRESVCLFRLGEIYNRLGKIELSMACHQKAFEIDNKLAEKLNPENHAFHHYLYSRTDEIIAENCPLCGEKGELHSCYNTVTNIDFIDGFNPIRTWMYCKTCRHIFARNYPTNLNGILHGNSAGFYMNPKINLFPLIGDIISGIKRHTCGNRLLEVGVGAGEFSAVAKEYGFTVTGIDVRKANAENVSKQLGINIFCSDFLAFSANEKFDVICMGDVLEHITDPVGAIQKVNQLISENGALWISTPNFDSAFSLYAKYLDPMWRVCEHLNYFSFSSLEKLLNSYGFEVVDYSSSRHYNGSMEVIAVKRQTKGSEEKRNKVIGNIEGKTKLNIGCGRDTKPGWINLDIAELPGVDVIADLNKCNENKIPLKDNSIDEIYASHVIEHISNTLPLMEELYRISQPEGKAIFRVPHGSHNDAYEDPTHVRQFFENSFSYFSQPYYWRADYGYRGDWLTSKVSLLVEKSKYTGKSAEYILSDIKQYRNIVKEMIVEMICIKPARPPKKELQGNINYEIILV